MSLRIDYPRAYVLGFVPFYPGNLDIDKRDDPSKDGIPVQPVSSVEGDGIVDRRSFSGLLNNLLLMRR